ncbi:MAG: hypothetical protein VZQ79_05910 [Ruminococcus sp.]|nr:hypothetical protein [Ruminococcus sp.]
MTEQSSIHFAKCRPGGQPERHNFRQYSSDDFRPSYFLPPEYQLPNTYKDLLEPDNNKADAAEAEKNARGFFDDLKAKYSGRGKRPKYENCRREAILNLSDDSTEADVLAVVKYLEEQWHIKTTSYAIHRDEGYIDKSDGSVHRNLHAHLLLDCLYLDTKTGKPKQAWRKISIGDLRKIQDDVASIMRMKRTKGNGRKHLDRKTYATVKAAQDKAAHQVQQAEQAKQAAAQETQQAQTAKQAAAKQAQETARQAEQVRHDIEVHKLTPSGILVNRALRDANAAQAEQIDKLRKQAQWTAAKHKSDLADKDRQIQEARDETDAKRQTIRQLQTQLDERDATIKAQAETINEQNDQITIYERTSILFADLAQLYQAEIPQEKRQAVEEKQKSIFRAAFDGIGKLLKPLQNLIGAIWHHKEREEAERLEREQAARLEAERQKQAEEARRNRGRSQTR